MVRPICTLFGIHGTRDAGTRLDGLNGKAFADVPKNSVFRADCPTLASWRLSLDYGNENPGPVSASGGRG